METKILYAHKTVKHILKLLANSTNLLLSSILLISFCSIQIISPSSTVDIGTNEESNHHLMGWFNIRIRNFTKKLVNITIGSNDLLRNDRKNFPTNVFPSSFIFYTDEIFSNLLNHGDNLCQHYIFKTARNANFIKEQIKHDKTKQPEIVQTVTAASDEDYFLDYEDNFVAKANNALKMTKITNCSSCQYRDKASEDSLESIKKHILMRLQLSRPPNITVPPPIVPKKILDLFYKNFNNSRIMPSSSSKYYFNNQDYKQQKNDSFTTNTEAGYDIILSDKEGDGIRYIQKKGDPDIMISDSADYYMDEEFSMSTAQYDEFYSRLHSIYVFPTKSRLHHNSKQEIFNFKYNSDPSRISSTILHIFIKGRNWIHENPPAFSEGKNMHVSIEEKEEILIIIYRVIRRPNTMNYTNTVKLVESRQKIPQGKGHWVEIEIKELSTYWMKAPNSTQSIVIRGMESWMRTFIVTEDRSIDNSLTMHIEIVTKAKSRHKRSAALDCRESDNEVRCCRYPLKVNFTNFGWNFIVAPQQFDAYFCNGECNIGYLEKHTHTHITSLSHINSFSTSAKPCCSPQKLSPLAILYFDNNNKLMYSTIPNMSVDKCSCS